MTKAVLAELKSEIVQRFLCEKFSRDILYAVRDLALSLFHRAIDRGELRPNEIPPMYIAMDVRDQSRLVVDTADLGLVIDRHYDEFLGQYEGYYFWSAPGGIWATAISKETETDFLPEHVYEEALARKNNPNKVTWKPKTL